MASFFGNVNQSKKLFQIKPPLVLISTKKRWLKFSCGRRYLGLRVQKLMILLKETPEVVFSDTVRHRKTWACNLYSMGLNYF